MANCISGLWCKIEPLASKIELGEGATMVSVTERPSVSLGAMQAANWASSSGKTNRDPVCSIRSPLGGRK